MSENVDNSTLKVPVSLRIEKLPNCGYLKLLAVTVSIAMFAEAVEINAFGFVLKIVQAEFSLSSEFMGFLGSASNVGMLVGALCTSFIIDRIGRRRYFEFCMIVWGIGGLIFAFAPNPSMLFVGRIIFGIGAGAQVPASLVLLSELFPAKLRANFVVLSLLASPFAVMFGATLATWLLQVTTWRILFIVVSCFALWVIAINKILPESPRWLVSKGRNKEAEVIVTRMEEKAIKSSGKPLVEVTAEEIENFNKQMEITIKNAESQKKVSYADLWRGKQQIKATLLNTIWPYMQMLGYFALSTWLTALLVDKGFSVVRSTSMIAIFAIGGIPAYFVMTKLLNTLGRKKTNIIMALVTAAAAYLYGMQNAYIIIIICGFIYQFCQYGYNMTCSTYWPEVFPTRIRGTGMGWTQAFGRLGGICGSIVVGFILGAGGYMAVFGLIVVMNLISVFAIGLLGPETKDVIEIAEQN